MRTYHFSPTVLSLCPHLWYGALSDVAIRPVCPSRVLTTLENLGKLKISGNLLILEVREFKIYSGNLSDVCIIVGNSTLNWLGGTVSGIDGASHHVRTHRRPFYSSVDFVRDNPGEPVPEETFSLNKIFCNSARKLPN